MTIETLLLWLFIGGIAGYIASLLVKGYGLGVAGNVVVGILGSIVSGAVLPRLGIFSGGDLLGQIIAALIGAVALLLAVGLVRRST
jgi:uncharacterized membrane protein YeaQ/YmgE (transglycosylase-associated protein family)